MQFHYCNHFLWTICCRMVHSNLNLMSETDVLVETPELVFNICHSHHYSWWLGTILRGQCSIGKHYFSFSWDWGIWPLLVLYNMASIFIYESRIWTLHWQRYLTSTDFIYCDAHLHLLSWIWTFLCDWDIWFPSCTFIAGDSALHGYLLISSKLFVLILLEIVWCRAELSALHRFKMLELCFSWTRRFGERTWGLRKFCQPEEHCTEHL